MPSDEEVGKLAQEISLEVIRKCEEKGWTGQQMLVVTSMSYAIVVAAVASTDAPNNAVAFANRAINGAMTLIRRSVVDILRRGMN